MRGYVRILVHICLICLWGSISTLFLLKIFHNGSNYNLPALSHLSFSRLSPMKGHHLMPVWLSVGNSAESQLPVTNGGSHQRERARDSGERGR